MRLEGEFFPNIHRVRIYLLNINARIQMKDRPTAASPQKVGDDTVFNVPPINFTEQASCTPFCECATLRGSDHPVHLTAR